jgi:hypothetical protein
MDGTTTTSNAVIGTATITDISESARRRMAHQLRYMADSLEQGAEIVEGGLISNNILHLAGDIQLKLPGE